MLTSRDLRRANIVSMRPDDPALGPTTITVGCVNFEAVPRDKAATLEKMAPSSPRPRRGAATW